MRRICRPASWKLAPLRPRRSLFAYHSILISNRHFTWQQPVAMYCSNPASDLETHCRYQYIDDVEKLERYKPGGYHPVLIGDVLHSRYQVVHELGYGTYSTVWLAYDQQRAAYSVVKICTADAPLREVEILHRLTKYRPNTQPGLAILPTIQDDFEIQGPNGRHRCYVSQTASCSVADAKFCCFFKIPVARAVVAQMILAVEYIHSHGYVHADLHLKNFLFRLPSSYDKFLPEHIYNRFGEPCKAPVVRLDGEPLPPNAPIYGVILAWLGKHADHILPNEANIMLVDFEEAFSPETDSRPGEDSHVPLAV